THVRADLWSDHFRHAHDYYADVQEWHTQHGLWRGYRLFDDGHLFIDDLFRNKVVSRSASPGSNNIRESPSGRIADRSGRILVLRGRLGILFQSVYSRFPGPICRDVSDEGKGRWGKPGGDSKNNGSNRPDQGDLQESVLAVWFHLDGDISGGVGD